jgi:hypothetical protein
LINVDATVPNPTTVVDLSTIVTHTVPSEPICQPYEWKFKNGYSLPYLDVAPPAGVTLVGDTLIITHNNFIPTFVFMQKQMKYSYGVVQKIKIDRICKEETLEYFWTVKNKATTFDAFKSFADDVLTLSIIRI